MQTFVSFLTYSRVKRLMFKAPLIQRLKVIQWKWLCLWHSIALMDKDRQKEWTREKWGATLLSTHILFKTQKLRKIELWKQQKRIWKEYLLWHPCHPRWKVPQQWPCVDVSSGSGEAAFSLATNDTSWPPSPAADTPHCPLAIDLPPYQLKTALRTDNNCMSQ